jgi:hypothetical protein
MNNRPSLASHIFAHRRKPSFTWDSSIKDELDKEKKERAKGRKCDRKKWNIGRIIENG